MALHTCSSGFARKQLEKHGWKEGKGLGKTESGIADPIKVKLKHDTAGVGHDLGEQFTYHWWDHVFNKAANNITVETDQNGVRVKQQGDNSKLISNKKQHTKNIGNKPLLYGNFVKSATLTEDGERPEDKASSSEDEDDESEDKKGASRINRDEELFRACGGRTAHKGARHGLNASGKLRRIQAQESLMSRGNIGSKDVSKSVSELNTGEVSSLPSKKRKRKRKTAKELEAENVNQLQSHGPACVADEGDDDIDTKQKRRTKSKKSKKTSPDVDEVYQEKNTNMEEREDRTEVKKSFHKAMDGMENGLCGEDGAQVRKAKKKRKKSKNKPKSL